MDDKLLKIGHVARTASVISPSNRMTETINDQSLLAGARRYDEVALSEIYAKYGPALFRYSVRLLGDPQLAEDCVAETFSRLLRELRRGRGPREHLRAYLYRVAHNWIVDHYRQPTAMPVALDPELPAPSGSEPSAIVKGRLEREQVRRALLRLTPDQQQVLALRYLEGLPNEQVATMMHKSVGAVKALQHRGLAALKKLIDDAE